MLELSADDGALSAQDRVTVLVTDSDAVHRFEARIGASGDDVEEAADGDLRVSSSDLELVFDSGVQTVGLRFSAVDIPRGAKIRTAYVQFQTDEAKFGVGQRSVWKVRRPTIQVHFVGSDSRCRVGQEQRPRWTGLPRHGMS